MLAPVAPAAAEEPSEPEAAVVPEELDLGRAARRREAVRADLRRAAAAG